MRIILSLTLFVAIGSPAYASKTVSGVVAVSTGPMQAYTQSIGRNLSAGDDVFMNDEVETGDTTRAQVLLRDESVFSLAPSSRIVFDEFVYDPSVGEGALQANLVSGGLRFVSGQLAKSNAENIKIKAGEATVGIRGTEIIAKHGDDGSTFVLLSGAMEIATASGRQLIERSGFGIDVSTDGMLGNVRPVPLAEINAILTPPKKQQSQSAKSDETSDSGEEDEAEGEGDGEAEEEATAEASDESEGESLADADSESSGSESSSETADDTQETASTESAGGASDSESEEASAFDAALTDAVSNSDDDGDVASAGLSDIAAASSDAESDATPSGAQADEPPTTNDTGSSGQDEGSLELTLDVETGARELLSPAEAVASIVENLAEDNQLAQGDEITAAQQPSIQLTLNTEATLTTDPYYSSNASLLVRSEDYFLQSSGQFTVTKMLLKEKFPDSFNGDDFADFTYKTDAAIDLSSYDAAFFYVDYDDNENDLTSTSELQSYRDFINTSGKKILTIGRQDSTNDMATPNTVLQMYHDGSTGYQYTAINHSSNSSTHELTPVSGSSSELLLGVEEFPAYFDLNGFQRIDFTRDLVSDPLDAAAAVDNGLLVSPYGDIAALDLGEKGAVFFGRFSCGANGDGGLGTSINANLVNNSREQFCRNLISSLAPDENLVDLEVGTLSVSGEAETASYRLISGNDNFKIVGNKLLLNADADLDADTYNLTVGVTPTGGEEFEKTLSLDVVSGIAEKKVIATRDTYNVGDVVSFPTENLVSHQGYLEDLSWVTIGSTSGGGSAANTGIITLHYRITEDGNTYDRFHEIEVNHDCATAYCKEFATSMDTEDDFLQDEHFEAAGTVDGVFRANDFASWSSFFTRFSSGVGQFTKNSEYSPGGVWNYTHNLAINYGTRSGTLNTDGTMQPASGNTEIPIDETWNFNFLESGGGCEDYICTLETNTTATEYDIRVNLANMGLPNGKHSLMVKSRFVRDADNATVETDYQPMTPQ